MTLPAIGPVSAALEADVRNWVRKHGIVLWLDLDNHYGAFVDRLIGLRAAESLPYEVKAYRGSHLELLLELEGQQTGVDKMPMLVHLPGFTEDSIRETPLLEFYFAGTRYRRALETLLDDAAGTNVRPEQIREFQERGPFTLEQADAWLTERMADHGQGFGAQLAALTLPAVVDDLLAGGFVAGRMGSEADRSLLWDRFAAWTGLSEPWRAEVLPGAKRPEDVAFVVASWALAVEYVNDLRRQPVAAMLQPARDLPRPVQEACHKLAAHLRERYIGFYRRTADETEAMLPEELEAAQAQDLGKIDTFRFEEDKVLGGAIDALASRQWGQAREWAQARDGGSSFWLKDDPARRSAWQLIGDAARLGQAIQAAGDRLDAPEGLDQAIERYKAVGSTVDRAHRHLEQHRTALLYPSLPEFERIRASLDRLKTDWRDWADRWAIDFNALCQRKGFLPEARLQQRTIFEEVVRPLIQEAVKKGSLKQEEGITALFVVDALRYEMGEELFGSLAETPQTTPLLSARLAELPSCTEVGMNVLAPVADRGKLRPVITDGVVLGFSAGEFRVENPETRRRAMQMKAGGTTCPLLSLDDVVASETTLLKQKIARAKLVVVHSDEIDRAGERGAGPAVFDGVLQKLRAGWKLLRDAGVRKFVFTADHGFLLIDEDARTAQPHGRKIDPKRRHVFSAVAADHPGEVRVPLADLGYEAPGHLMFPEGTALFETGRRATGFVHGGNSLQERLIPVLSLVHRSAVGGTNSRFEIEARVLDGVAGMHCVSARVKSPRQGELGFAGAREIELAVRAPEDADVRVEPCQARGGATVSGGSIMARVDEPFELFFRLHGPSDQKVVIELHHLGAEAEVVPLVVDGRFAVTAARSSEKPDGNGAAGAKTQQTWLQDLPEGGVRQVFSHLASYGMVTEQEATAMLGGPREFRKFSNALEEYTRRAPFDVRTETTNNVKRYIREGSAG